jgi:hypothetical protein
VYVSRGVEYYERELIKLEAEMALGEEFGLKIDSSDVESLIENLLCLNKFDLALKLASTQSN